MGMLSSTLTLFKSIVVDKHIRTFSIEEKEMINKVNKKTIKNGYVIDPEIIVSTDSPAEIIRVIEDTLIVKGSQINNSFHKSWKKVATASDEQLFIEQVIHYFTTYGAEFFGFGYDPEFVYVPKEKLKVPGLSEDISLMYIKGKTKKELKVRAMDMLKSGVALKEDTISCLYDIIDFVGIDEADIELVKNKEMKMFILQKLNLVPSNPIEFLRYLVFEITGKTLLIKSNAMFKEIRLAMMDRAKRNRIHSLLKLYDSRYKLSTLASIFYRFKPLFLAIRVDERIKPLINSLRRLAVTNHKPMKEDPLNNIVKYSSLDPNFKLNLDGVSIFRKIRLLSSLNYRVNPLNNSVLYKIRNGKSWATKRHVDWHPSCYEEHISDLRASIIESIREKVEGKKIYIPGDIEYALPATEKQFTGNFPSGTKVSVPDSMIFGIHWDDVRGRVDLDLSLTSIDGDKYGWNGSYRNDERTIMFSGDMTAAPPPHGASELFYVNCLKPGTYMMTVNHFNHEGNEDGVPFQIVVARDNTGKIKNNKTTFRSNYLLDPNEVIATAQTNIKAEQMILGSLVVTESGCSFVFSESVLGKSRSLDTSKSYIKDTMKYMADYYQHSISLREIMENAGATIITDKEKITKNTINLSCESITKDSIISLLS